MGSPCAPCPRSPIYLYMARQTLKECVDDYLLDKAAKETRRAYDRALRQFLGFMNVASVEDLAGVDRGAITRFRNHLRDELGRSPAYTNRQICALSGFFKWLLSEEEIKANPCEFVRRYKVEDESRTEGLSETEIQAMVEATKDGSLRGLRDRAILVTLYYEGLRRGSLARLEMRDLRTHRQVLVLRNTKTSDYKEIPLRPETAKSIDDYLTFLATELGIEPGERDPVFVSFSDRSRGKRISPNAVLQIVKARARQAGISRRVVAHSVRHATATHALDHGASIEEVAELLTHADLGSTRRYDRKRKSRSKAAAAALPRLAL
jgi:integrase/recombinase XerD